MNKSKNLIGKTFGKLIVMSQSKSILAGQKVKRYWGAWKCLCQCGNIVIVKTVDLNRKRVSSCGCLKHESKSKLKAGDKVNRLYLIQYNKGKWKCSCECGNIITVKTNSITSNNTKSCGCLKEEVSKNKIEKLIEGRRQFDPRITSARRKWQNYKFQDKMFNINFEDFYDLSQMNCYYCGINPNISYNYFKAASTYSSNKSKELGDFIYNGLDRVDSKKYHTLDNVVTCCYNCNRAKNNRDQNVFINWIKNLKINKNNFTFSIKKLPDNNSLRTSIKCVFYNYKKDSNLTLEEFYSISQMDCFYCGEKPNNIFNRAKTDKKAAAKSKINGDYIYNGLDRINSNLSHNKDNVVACCKYCNFAKSNLNIQEFNDWIIRAKKYNNLL